MPQPTPEQHQEFLGYWQEQFNMHDIFIRLSGAPRGYIAWAASRTMLEVCIKKVGSEGRIDYNQIPAYSLLYFTPANGDVPVDAAQSAVEAYHTDRKDPEACIRMNMGCLAIAEYIKSKRTQ